MSAAFVAEPLAIEHFAQCFYDEVRIPVANVVGGLDNGWQTAMTTLGFERGTGTVMHQIELAETVEQLVEIAREQPLDGGNARLIDDGAVAAELATLKAEVMGLRSLTETMIARGMKLGEMADTLSLSPKTVSVYRARVLEKLSLRSNAEIAAYALRHGMIE